MNKHIFPALLLGSAATLAACGAQASESLARAQNCMSCHAPAKRLIGPAFKDIAARYKGKGAEEALVNKVKQGGSGSFGAVPMPANPNLSDTDARTLVRWILQQ